jgi:hypothetical protein
MSSLLRSILLGRLGDFLGRPVRLEALANRNHLCAIDEEVERLRPDDITASDTTWPVPTGRLSLLDPSEAAGGRCG